MSELTLKKPDNFHGYVVVADGKYQYGTIEIYNDEWEFLPNTGGCSMSLNEVLEVACLLHKVIEDNS